MTESNRIIKDRFSEKIVLRVEEGIEKKIWHILVSPGRASRTQHKGKRSLYLKVLMDHSY